MGELHQVEKIHYLDGIRDAYIEGRSEVTREIQMASASPAGEVDPTRRPVDARH
jgi:hypothetical protein